MCFFFAALSSSSRLVIRIYYAKIYAQKINKISNCSRVAAVAAIASAQVDKTEFRKHFHA